MCPPGAGETRTTSTWTSGQGSPGTAPRPLHVELILRAQAGIPTSRAILSRGLQDVSRSPHCVIRDLCDCHMAGSPSCRLWALRRQTRILLPMAPPASARQPPGHKNLITFVGKRGDVTPRVELTGRELELAEAASQKERRRWMLSAPPSDRCGGRRTAWKLSNEHSQPVPEAFLWASYLGGLGALREGGARPARGPELRVCRL